MKPWNGMCNNPATDQEHRNRTYNRQGFHQFRSKSQQSTAYTLFEAGFGVWNDTEPNNMNKKEFCAALSFEETLMDVDCDVAQYRYICEREIGKCCSKQLEAIATIWRDLSPLYVQILLTR